MERVKSLILNLKSMGYRNHQVRSIIESCVGNKRLGCTRPPTVSSQSMTSLL